MKETSLSIGKRIVKDLKNSQEFNDMFNNRLFPLVAEQGTDYPFVVYRRSSVNIARNKDIEDDNATLDITVISNNYRQTVEGIEIVRAALEKDRDIRIETADEYYSNDGYIQNLTVSIDVEND